MFRHLRCIAIATQGLFFAIGAAPAQTCTPPPTGMANWYGGDGNANDLLGRRDGELHGGVEFVAGKVGLAFGFNGVNQFVKLPPDFLPYPTTGNESTAPLTVDAWFRTSTGGVILGQQAGVGAPVVPTGGWVPAIYVGTDGFLYAEVFWGGVTPLSSATKVNDGVFHHVAVVYDGATETVYLDAVPIGSVAIKQKAYASTYAYQLGAGYTLNWPAGNNGYYYFQGVIDEVEFFNRALTWAEIQAIVNAGSAGKCKTPPGVCTPPPAGMLNWYPGDGDAQDWTGRGDGTLKNGATFALGRVGLAFSLDGVSQYVLLPANLVPYPAAAGGLSNAPVSFDAWFQTATGGVILGQQGEWDTASQQPNGWVPAVYVGTDGFLHAEMFWGGTVAPVSSDPKKVNDGVFHHVAIVYDGTNETVFLDGIAIGVMAMTQRGYTSNYQYLLGTGNTLNWPAGNGGFFYFRGLIDEVEFFNRALSQTEIQAIVNAGGAGKCKNRPPVALCRNVTVDAGASGTASASIDDGSYDPDPGDTIALTQAPPGPYPLGPTAVTLTATDDHGATGQCTGTVTVTNPPPPAPSELVASPDRLWPPNHKMVPVTVAVNGQSAAGSCRIVSVSSNEPAGDAWVITGDLTLSLRAERSGNGGDRVYTISVQCGGGPVRAVAVTVPHDQGGKR